jgi:hypothetical protein
MQQGEACPLGDGHREGMMEGQQAVVAEVGSDQDARGDGL